MIIPLNVATDGYLGCDSKTLAIASSGYLCTITIETIATPSGGYLAKGMSHNLRRTQRPRISNKFHDKDDKVHKKEEEYEEFEYFKKITVFVNINGVEYIETKLIGDIPDLSVDDIDVQVSEVDIKPRITITVIKKS